MRSSLADLESRLETFGAIVFVTCMLFGGPFGWLAHILVESFRSFSNSSSGAANVPFNVLFLDFF